MPIEIDLGVPEEDRNIVSNKLENNQNTVAQTGRNAAWSGRDLDSNPFKEGTGSHEQWRAAYVDAQRSPGVQK